VASMRSFASFSRRNPKPAPSPRYWRRRTSSDRRKSGATYLRWQASAPLHLRESSVCHGPRGTRIRLWVVRSTRVYHWHAGAVESFGEEAGLPDRQVQSHDLRRKNLCGTVLGVAVFDTAFSTSPAPGVLATSLLATDSNLIVGSRIREFLTIPLAARQGPHLPHSGQDGELAEVRQLFVFRKTTFMCCHAMRFIA